MSKTLTITSYAEQLLQHVHYVDIYGRNVGLDFHTIRAMIKEKFPKASASQAVLRYIKCRMVAASVQLPARPRVRSGSRIRPAANYTRALLMRKSEDGLGLTFRKVTKLVRESYPEVKPMSLMHVCRQLRAHGFTPPDRPAPKGKA